jgi:hypothetical protein
LTAPGSGIPVHPVKSLRYAFLWLTLLLWGPATVHCALEQVWGHEHEACAAACAAEAECHDHDSHADHAALEEGQYRPGLVNFSAPAPVVSVVAGLRGLMALLLAQAGPPELVVGWKDDSSGWVPSWAFSQRAVWPARAPNRDG